MFEKEAEEYAKDSFRTFVKGIREIAKIAFQKGAEFGYNKALEEATHNYNAIIADYDKRIAELEKENAELKAGRPKWHKVADGDLPKEHKIYLVAIKENGLAIAYFNGLHWETKFNLGDFGHCVETVIAWCEIPTFTDKK